MAHIPFYRATLNTEKTLELIKNALDERWLTTGPLTARFTTELQTYLKTESLLCVSSCTIALQLALTLCDLKPGDEVLLPTNTFMATLETVHLAGLTPVLVDTDLKTFNADLDDLERKITLRTRAIISVPFAGNAPDMTRVQKICKDRGLIHILDNAHALETQFEERFLHEFADYSCYSFYATKNLTTAEGGAIVCPREKLERARSLSLHGMSRNAWNRYAGGSWEYDIIDFGFKANLTDIHAAIGLTQIPEIESNLKRRADLVKRYNDAFDLIPQIRRQHPLQAANVHAHHLYCVSISPDSAVSRKQIIETLTANSIGSSVHFIPLYRFTAVKERYGFNINDFPNSENYFQGAFTLPLYPDLNSIDQKRIIDTVVALFNA